MSKGCQLGSPMAVTGRHVLNVFLASQTAMVASASAMLTNASTRALANTLRWRAWARESATRSHMSVGVSPAQNFAVSVWNSVRTALSMLPKAFTSLRSRAYSSLGSECGPSGLNCDGEVRANGVVVASVRNFGGPDPPGVGCQSPGA